MSHFTCYIHLTHRTHTPGAGEIFTTATSYDVAFMIAPKEQKGLASGINLFVFGAISNFICIGIYKACKDWFPANATVEEEYAASTVYNYLWVLFGIAIFGIFFNLLPPVTNWLERTIERSSMVNSKGMTKSGQGEGQGAEAEAELAQAQEVLEEGSEHA